MIENAVQIFGTPRWTFGLAPASHAGGRWFKPHWEELQFLRLKFFKLLEYIS